MRWKALAAFALLATAMLVEAGMASAEDFNFTVPIRLISFPRDVTQGEVWCWVGLADMPLLHIGGFGPDRSGKVLGRGRSVFPIDGDSGGFSGNIAVRFSVDPGKNPADAAKYWCVLRLGDSGNTFAMIGERVQPNPGAQLVTSATGSLIPLPVRETPARGMPRK